MKCDQTSIAWIKLAMFSAVGIAVLDLLTSEQATTQMIVIWLWGVLILSVGDILRCGFLSLIAPTASLAFMAYSFPGLASDFVFVEMVCCGAWLLRFVTVVSFRALVRSWNSPKRAKKVPYATVKIVVPRLPANATASAAEILRAYGLTEDTRAS